MDGSRRVRATSVLPRYSPPCLFTGHLSTKSNAFCTDSSSLRLSTLQLVKNHMAIHYNKILSAKAAVDCSIPVSVNTSIKYADQQRREKLRKELARCEKEFKLSKSAMQTNSKMNSKFFVNSLQKPSGEPQDQDVFIEEMTRYPSFSKSLIPSSEGLHLSLPESSKMLMSGTQKHASTSPSRHSGCGHGCDRRPRSAHQFQVALAKTPSGDLLEKHSGLRCLCCGPLDPKPAALELMGLNHGRTRRFLHTLSSAAVVPWRPAPGSLRWLRAPGEGEPMRQLVSTQYVPSSEWNY